MYGIFVSPNRLLTSSQVIYDFISMETRHNGPVESLAFDPVHCRLASAGGGVPQVWKFSAAGVCLISASISNIFLNLDLGTMTPILKSTEERIAIARNIFFCDDGASIVLCYLESHEM